MKDFYRQLSAGLVAAGTLIGLTVFSGFVFWFNIVISVMIGLGTYFSLPHKKSDHEIEVATGITKAQLENALSTLNEYIEKFRVEKQKCPEQKIETIIGNICKVLESIYQNFRQDPGDINRAYQFFDQYLEKSYNIVSQYNRLALLAIDGSMAEQLTEAEQHIARILKGFEGFYQKCLQDDFMELDVESETLAAILEIDQPFLDVDDSADKPDVKNSTQSKNKERNA